MLTSSFYVVLGLTACAVLLGWAYFRSYRLARPSIGVINLEDVAFMVVVIVLVPYLYLALPLWVVATVFALAMLSILYIVCEPVIRSPWAIWAVALVFLATDVGANLHFGPNSTAFFLVNNAMLVLAVAGVANLWAQSGMKARDVALLGAGLALYDFIATSLLPLMTDLIGRLASIPFAPVITWGVEPYRVLVGLGDLLLAAVFPLTMVKGFGRGAGIAAISINLGSIAATMAYLQLANVRTMVPLMIVLGPLMALQYGYWVRRLGQERTMLQYTQAEPSNRRAVASAYSSARSSR